MTVTATEKPAVFDLFKWSAEIQKIATNVAKSYGFEADDVAQEVRIHFLEHAEKFAGQSDNYIRKSIKNRSLDVCSKRANTEFLLKDHYIYSRMQIEANITNWINTSLINELFDEEYLASSADFSQAWKKLSEKEQAAIIKDEDLTNSERSAKSRGYKKLHWHMNNSAQTRFLDGPGTRKAMRNFTALEITRNTYTNGG